MLFSLLHAAEFYCGLERLHDYEVAIINGIPAALPPVENDFLTALRKGNCIAPYFLRYMKQRGLIESFPDDFPNLATVPSHKAQGAEWVTAYEIYLEYLKIAKQCVQPQILDITKVSKLKSVMQSAQRSSAQLKQELSRLFDQLFGMDKSFAKLLSAKLTCQTDVTAETISGYYKRSIDFLNIWAMQECVLFLREHSLPIPSKLLAETTVLALADQKGPGAILASYEREGSYKNFSNEQRFQYKIQWLIEAIIHGENNNPFAIIELYLNPVMRWSVPIENVEQECEKWFDWILERKSQYANFHQGFQMAFKALFQRQNQDKYDDLRIKMYMYSNQSLEALPMSVDCLPIMQRSLYRIYHRCPDAHTLMQNSTNANELGRYFELQARDYSRAEVFYRKALELDPSHPSLQYNVAKMLLRQNKGAMERRGLFRQSAAQGDQDAIVEYVHDIFNSDDHNTESIAMAVAFVQQLTQEPFASQKDVALKLLRAKLRELQEEGQRQLVAAEPAKVVGELPSAAFEFLEAEATDGDTDTDVAPETEAVARAETAEERATRKMAKAKEALKEFAEKPVGKVSTKEFRRMAKYLRVVWGQLDVSTRGRATGSGVNFEGHNFDVPHGSDRPSPGTQTVLRGIARRALEK